MKKSFFVICFIASALFWLPSAEGAKTSATQKKQAKPAVKKAKKGVAKTPTARKSSKSSQSSTTYKLYKIKKGDQLIRIARLNGTTVQELIKVNPALHATNLKLGTTIKIPVTVKTVKKPEKEKPAKEAATDFSYVVKEGDTLHSICDHFNISQDEIKRLNNLKDDTLVIGSTLSLQGLKKETAPASTSAESYSLFPHDDSDYDGDEELPGTAGEQEPAITDANLPYSLRGDELKKLVNQALDYLGTTYKYGGSSVSAIDCSAFVKTVFKEVNINLPRTSREQFTLGTKVDLENLREGDLLFFAKKKRINHVAIYIGNDMYIHAARRGKGVVVSKISNVYFKKYFTGAKRIFKLDVPESKPLPNVDNPPENIHTN